MRAFLIWIFTVLLFSLVAQKKDSLFLTEHFIELKAGSVCFLRSYDDLQAAKIVAKGSLSGNYNLSFGRRVKHTWFGFYADYTSFRLIGEPVIVGYSPYKSSVFYPYLIRQEMGYSVLALGTFVRREFRTKKMLLEPGLSLSTLTYQSAILVKNHFVGEPPRYSTNYAGVPDEGGSFLVGEDEYVEPKIPIAGLHLDISYEVRHNFRLRVFNSFYFNTDVQLRQGNSNMDYKSLPKNYVYDIGRQYWLSSGIAATLSF